MTAVRLGWFRRARETLEIRLHAIDAPEYDQPLGREATHRLRRIAEGKRFTLKVWSRRTSLAASSAFSTTGGLASPSTGRWCSRAWPIASPATGEMNGLGHCGRREDG